MYSTTDARIHLAGIGRFIGKAQRAAILEGLKGEESQYFCEKLLEIWLLTQTMPATYGNDGEANQTAQLHYFMKGCDWWIMEKDKETEQHQAFGYADLGYGGELGYISIVEILENGAELDLHFPTCKLSDIKNAEQQVPWSAD